MLVLCKRGECVDHRIPQTNNAFRNFRIRTFGAAMPTGYWTSMSNQRKFMDELGNKLKIKRLDDWSSVTTAQFTQNGGSTLYNLYGSSLHKLLRHVYPEHSWPDRAKKAQRYWNNISNQRTFMDELGRKLNIKQLDDWNAITCSQFRQSGGSTLLKVYGGSLHQLLQCIYPGHDWKVTNRPQVHKGYWNDVSNQRKLVDELGKNLGIKQLDDWNNITSSQFIQSGGSTLWMHHGGSLFKLLQHVYPNHSWKVTDRPQVTSRYWNEKSNQRKFMDELAKILGIKSESDWLLVSSKDILTNGGGWIFMYHGSLLNALRNIYGYKLSLGKYISRSQQELLRIITQLFEGHKVESNVKCVDFRYNLTATGIFEADVLIPSLSLAFEYQGEHHYYPVWYNNTGTDVTASKDKEKHVVLTRLGFTLISVPYWWDRSRESLAGTIRRSRPDLLTTNQSKSLIDYSVPSHNKRFMMSQHYNSEDPTGWWMSEKYDGVRGYWDGSQMFSRNSNTIVLPNDIKGTFPDVIMDGEIWFGRGTLPESLKVAHHARQIQWERFQFMVFDAPKHAGVLEERMDYLKRSIPADHPFIKVVPLVQCKSKTHLEQFFAQVTSSSGEGIILREPRSLYTLDRSSSFLKYKPYLDEEVLVESKGFSKEYWLREVDSWNCVTRNNTKFSCTAMSAISSQIQPGMVVTIKYSGFTHKGTPRRPRISGIRSDITIGQFWNEGQNSTT